MIVTRHFLSSCVCLLGVSLFLSLVVHPSESLSCLPCDRTVCPTPPPPNSCQLGRDICGCCSVCRPKLGETCSNFTPQCADGLVCKADGVDERYRGCLYTERPIWYVFVSGTCIKRPKSFPIEERCHQP